MDYIKFLGLQLFADGAAAGESGVTGSDAGSQTGVTSGNPEGTAAAEQNVEAAKPSFDELVKGEYKDAFNERVQKIVQARLKGTEETVKKLDGLAPVLDLLSRKYGVDASDVDALKKAVESDDSYFEQESLDTGIPVDQLRKIHAIEQENAALKAAQEQSAQQAEAQQRIAAWMAQAEQVKSIYPAFDLDTEIVNPQFQTLLRTLESNGFPNAMQVAFETVHRDQIQPAAMQYAAKKAQEATVNAIKSGSSRPSENGSGQAASLTKIDPNKLTRAQIKDIRERVARGERITF